VVVGRRTGVNDRTQPLRGGAQVKTRPRAVIVLAVSLVCGVFPLTGWIQPERAAGADYDRELTQLNTEIARLARAPLGAGTAVTTTRFVYTLYRRAALTGSASDVRAAKRAVDDAIADLGPLDDLYLIKANLDFRIHRLADTKADLERLRSRAASVQVETLKADVDLQEGRYDAARKGYENVLRNGRPWGGLVRLADMEARTGDPAAADALYAEAEDGVSAKEMRAYAWIEMQRGLLQLRRGRYDNAMAHYQTARRAYSGYWLVDEHIAEVLGAQGKFDEALALYGQVIARAPSPELQQALGDLYAFRGQRDRARPWHDKALAAYLESAQRGEVHYYHHLATFYSDVREDGAAAVRWARKDLDIRENFATQDALAWALYRNGQFADAHDEMRKALTCGVVDAHLVFHAAMISLAAGRIDEGTRLLQRAAEINPRYAAFHVHR